MGGQRSCIIHLFAFPCSRSRGVPLEEDGPGGGGCFFRKRSGHTTGRPGLSKGGASGSSGAAVAVSHSGGNKWLQTATRKRWKPGLESIVEDKLLALVDRAGEMPPHVFLTTTTTTAKKKKKTKTTMVKKKPKPSAPRKPPPPPATKRPSTGKYAKINWMYERRPPLHSAYPLGILF